MADDDLRERIARTLARAYWEASRHFAALPAPAPGRARDLYTAADMGGVAATARRLASLAIHHKALSLGADPDA